MGLEMMCFGKTEHFEIEYAGGGYTDLSGQPVNDVIDMNCYVCSISYFTIEGDFVPFCPNCGHIDRKRFDTREAMIEFLRGSDFSYLKRNGLTAVAVQTWDHGDWQLRFTPDIGLLDTSGKYKAVRKL
jgi:hypothetical protein